MADSWLTDGDCKECRRQKYCRKPCARARERSDRELKEAVVKAMLGIRKEHNIQYPFIK